MDDPQQCVGNGQMIGVLSAYDLPVSYRIKDRIFYRQPSFSVGRGRAGGHGLVRGRGAVIEKLL